MDTEHVTEHPLASAKRVVDFAQHVKQRLAARYVQERAAEGGLQRQLAAELGTSTSTINRLVHSEITYRPQSQAEAGVCDAIEAAAWGTPQAMRENYIAISGSIMSCPRCGDHSEATGRFCSQCRFPFDSTYRPPAVATQK